jgi:predicted RecA/RadA family phage recombinase
MKKIKVFIFIFVMLMLLNTRAYANDIKVYVDSVEVKFDVLPIIEKGRTLVPMRAIFEALGAEIYWDEDTKTASAFKDDIAVAVQVNNIYANKNNNAVELDVAPKIVNNRMLVPLRFIGEAFGNIVNWDGDTRTVTVDSKDTEVSDEPEDTATGSSNIIVGLWSDNIYSGIRFDAAGLPLYDYSGNWVIFRDDGTYMRISASSGAIISGAAVQKGKYAIDSENDTITFSESTEDWFPSRTSEAHKAYKDKAINDYTVNLVINEEEITIQIGSSLLPSDKHKFWKYEEE